MKIKSITSTVACLVLFTIFAVPAIATTSGCYPPCGSCYECIAGHCVWVCSAGQNCCSGSCCSGNCCNGHCCNGPRCCGSNCYNPATQKCCTDANTPYICDINQSCCNGICCDAGKKCCTDSNSPYCCDSNQICCNGKCCKNWQCCINGSCVDPICDGCHTISETLWECHHWVNDPEGTPCSTIECIENVMDTASCSHKDANWPCNKSRCDTLTVSPWEPEIVQTIHRSPCPGGTLYWELWKKIYWGCGCDVCLPEITDKACALGSCLRNPTERVYRRGSKKACGICGYIYP